MGLIAARVYVCFLPVLRGAAREAPARELTEAGYYYYYFYYYYYYYYYY